MGLVSIKPGLARGGFVREASLAIGKLGICLADGLGFDQAWRCARWFGS